MKKRYIFLSVIFLFIASAGWADTVYLKDGRVFNGKIISETKYSTKIMVKGFPKVFYADEIDHAARAEEKVTGQGPSVDVIKGEVSPEKRELILRLLSANGALEGIRQTVRNFVGQLSPQKKAEFEAWLNADALVDRLIPIYGKYYTEEQLKEMIRFYSSSAGQRALEVTPKIMEESIKASLDYFKDMEKNDQAKDKQ